MAIIKEGLPFSPGKTTWNEMMEWNWTKALNRLGLFLRNPTPEEVQSVRKGKIEFGLVVEQDILFLVFRILGIRREQDGIPWSDAPFSWHITPEEHRFVPPEANEETRQIIHPILVNAATGITKVVRTVTFSPEFTKKLYQAVKEQSEKPFYQVKYDRQLRWVQASYTSEQLYQRSIVTCVGGE